MKVNEISWVKIENRRIMLCKAVITTIMIRMKRGEKRIRVEASNAFRREPQMNPIVPKHPAHKEIRHLLSKSLEVCL